MRQRHLALALAAIVLTAVAWCYAAQPEAMDAPSGTDIVADPCPDELGDVPEEEPAAAAFASDLAFPPREPAWHFQAEALILRRESGDRVFATLGDAVWTLVENPSFDEETDDPREKFMSMRTLSFTTPLRLDDADMNRFQGGGRLLLGRTLGPRTALEVSYFDMEDWAGTAVVTDHSPFIATAEKYGDDEGRIVSLTELPGSLFSPLSHFGEWLHPNLMYHSYSPAEIPFDGNNLTEIRYSSGLNNLEWNLQHWIVRVPHYTQISLILGGRYMSVDESFGFRTVREPSTFAGATTNVTTDTHNPMIGAQIGATYEVCVSRRWWLDCKIKGAFMSNRAVQETLFAHEGEDAYDGAYYHRANRSAIASAMDATFTTRWLIGPHLNVHFGYQILYVSGLALAPDNFSDDADVLRDGPAAVVTNGEILYHGLNLGLTCVW